MFQRHGRQAPAVPATDVVPSRDARIEFRAYADDYTLSGEVAFEGGRLREFLELVDDLTIHEVRLIALDDGREHALDSAVVRREELCAVVATGPRGDPHRRFRTRPYPMRATIGPYAVVGYLNVTPNVDPQTIIHRRQIIALSPARIAYVVHGERRADFHDALLLLRTKVDVLVAASDEDLRLADLVKLPVTSEGPGEET